MSKIDLILGQARERGVRRGHDDQWGDVRNYEPLSGEWAGESVTELLGDLLELGYSVRIDDGMEDDICDAYLDGYDSVFI